MVEGPLTVQTPVLTNWSVRGPVCHDDSICQRREEVVGAATANLASCEIEDNVEHVAHLPVLRWEVEDHRHCQQMGLALQLRRPTVVPGRLSYMGR